VQARRGDWAGAESSYRAVLQRQPNNTDALVGLAGVLSKQGRGAEASEILAQAEANGGSRAVGRLQAEQLRFRRMRRATLRRSFRCCGLRWRRTHPIRGCGSSLRARWPHPAIRPRHVRPWPS